MIELTTKQRIWLCDIREDNLGVETKIMVMNVLNRNAYSESEQLKLNMLRLVYIKE